MLGVGDSLFLVKCVNEVLDLCNQRQQLKQQKYMSAEAGLEYRKVNTEVRKKMEAAKEKRREKKCMNIEKGMMSGNNEEAYNTLKALTQTQQRKSSVIEDSCENILTESKVLLNRWTE